MDKLLRWQFDRLKKKFIEFICPLPPDEWEPPRLHHYTSMNGLTSIISSESVQASSLYYLNDPEEFNFAFSEISSVLGRPDFADFHKHDPSNGWAIIGGGDLSISDTFVACFTEVDDNLPMWIAYADGARGVNIAIPYSSLADISGWQLAKVCYDADVVKNFFNDLLEAVTELIVDAEDHDDAIEFVEFVSRAIHILSASLKKPEYAHEREWRLVGGHIYSDGVYYRSNNRWIIPSIKIPIFIRDRRIRVICGPLAPFNLLEPVLLRMFGIAEKYEPWPAVKSRVNYRG